MHGADGLLSLAPVQLRASSGELAWLSTAGQLTFGKLDKAQKLRNSVMGEACCVPDCSSESGLSAALSCMRALVALFSTCQ